MRGCTIFLVLAWTICCLAKPLETNIIPRQEDCIGNAGGPTISSANCSYISSYSGKSKDEAMACCETIPYRTAMPGSSDGGQAANTNHYIAILSNEIEEPIFWSSLSYTVVNGLHHPTGKVDDGLYMWKHGTDLHQDHPCIAVAYDTTVNLMLIQPEDCSRKLDFLCVTANVQNACGDGEVPTPIYGSQCSADCVKTTTAKTTTGATEEDSSETTKPDSGAIASPGRILVISILANMMLTIR